MATKLDLTYFAPGGQYPNRNLKYSLAADPMGTVQEYVSINGAPPLTSYEVRLFREIDNALIAKTWSVPGTGKFTFLHLATDTKYFPVVIDPTGYYKAQASGPMTAVS